MYARARVRVRGSLLRGAGLARLAAAALALAGATARAAPVAGTPIDNTARAVAQGAIGGTVTLPSNTVRVVVQPVEGVALRPDRGGTGAPGGSVTLAHRLVNTGNFTADFRLDALNLGLDGFDASSLALAEDRDHDGMLSPGDTPIANGGALTLAPGDSADVLLTLGVPASAPLGSIALVRLAATGLAQGTSALVTDTLRTPALGSLPALVFFDAADYRRPTRIASLGAPLQVEAIALGCDLDPARVDTVRITLRSLATGDRETYAAAETGPHTGLFRVVPGAPTVTGPATSASGDGVLATTRGDQVTAELAGCGGTLTRASVWIEPTGVVYESRSNAAVGGVRVRLVDVSGAGNGGAPGGPARVLAGDGVTPSPAEVTTDALGRYSFPLVRRSTYRLDVLPPEPYRFPSRMGLAGLPAGHLTDAAGSYGGSFTTVDSLAPVLVDVPVDQVGSVALYVEQTASQPQVEWGDELDYVLRVANRSDSTLDAVTLREQLPPGFAYTRGTTRGLAGSAAAGASAAPWAEPSGTGPALAFALGTLGPGGSFQLTFRARVRAGAPTGEALAVAAAEAGEVRSNAAPARVLVRGDVFGDEGGILGTVSVLTERDSAAATPDGGYGLAGVRLYLDDGTWAVTDALGRYSFTGITPRTHAIKLDRTSLPPRTRPVALDHRDQGTPGLRFVDLTRGELVRADFAVVGDTATLREVQERRVAVAARDEAARALARALQRPEDRAPPGDARSLPASAIVTGERESGEGGAARVTSAPAAPPPGAPAGAVVALEQLLPTLDPELGFVGIADLDTVSADQISVRVKARQGTELALRVNGERVPDSRVGRRVTVAGLEAWEYVGVSLRPGLNVLELAPPHARGRVAVRVVAPAGPGALLLVGPRASPADGRSPATFTLVVTDSLGVPVGARTLVTLETSLGTLANEDLDPATPGVQLAVEGGRARVVWQPPATPGRARLTATSGALRAAADVEFLPEMRPLLAVGTLEGVVTLDGWRGPARGAGSQTGFEQPIGEFLAEATNGRTGAGARGALFMKGRVRDDMQLTLGYDSDRPADLRQFRDLEPDRGYPVQGDASVRGYDAQSTGRLYARLDRRDASLLYGDLTTGGSGRSLANYARSLTGAAAAWGDDAAGGRAFTSRERSHHAIDELPARGVSGPYMLTRAPIVENSERVEVLVRDRDQPAVVLSSDVKQRFTDYELDPVTGRLLFRAPVPSLDSRMNPVSVRVSYEVPDGTGAAWVHGVELHQRMNPHLDLAGTYVDDHDATQPLELRGASARVRIAPRTTLETEWARTHQLPGGEAPADAGDAERLELDHDDPRTQGRLWAMTAAQGFANPGAGLAGGRTEAGGRLVTRLAERTRLNAEALYSADVAGQTRRSGLLASVDQTLSPAWRGELGLRVAGESRASGGAEPPIASVRTRLLGQWPTHPEWSGYGEVEQDTQERARRMAAVGGEYRFNARGRAYVRHEIASTLDGAWSLSTQQQRIASVAGIDADLAHDAHVFSEYRLAEALAGRDAQAAVGLRNAWRLDNGMRVGGSFERVSPIAGPNAADGPSTALTGSVDWAEDPVWKGSARMEVRTSRAADQILQTMAAAVKLDTAWTALGRHALTIGGSRASGRDAREQLQLAFAYRDGGGRSRPTGRWDGLGRWELLYERDPADGLRHRRVANVLGVNATGRFPRGWSSNLAWAGKLTRDESAGLLTASGAQWLHGRVLLDFAADWDAGMSASVLSGRSLAERQVGLGLEVGRQLPAGTWLSFGFNRFGYSDDELTGEEWTRMGAYLRLRARFDESLFGAGGGRR